MKQEWLVRTVLRNIKPVKESNQFDTELYIYEHYKHRKHKTHLPASKADTATHFDRVLSRSKMKEMND